MKGYYSDKDENPWHKINKNIQKFITKESSKDKLSETLILLREAVFGALEILSFGLIDKIATGTIIKALTKEESWKLGRRSARNLCLDIADILVEKGDTRYLLPSALKRDGFGFLIPKIEEVQFENFKKAKPKIIKNQLNLAKLEKSLLGSKFLREQMIMETKIDAKDPRVAPLLEAYELQLVEIEVDCSSRIKPPLPTEQVTLDGKLVLDGDEDTEVKVKKQKSKNEQAPLTEFLSEKAVKKKKAPKKKSSKKGRGRKK
ncbi:MAG: hypothetical protein ACTSU3_00955 [Candidatus Thorarchaeota archaeon]